MTFKTVDRLNFTGDSAEEIKRLQDSVIRSVNPLCAVPLIDGVLLGPVNLTTTLTPVNHGLGRQFIGWHVRRINANATVWEDFTWAQQKSSILMRASSNCQVYLWVY
jgi:hypothetical protein